MSDPDLLRRFVHRQDQSAFAELVRRHLDLVYAAARRHVNGDARAAEDITQQVFIDLARKAHSLLGHPCLTGWLYACARFTALNTIRTEQRRAAREREAAVPTVVAPTADWESIRPIIDDALQELDERDRELVLLRFFGQQSFPAIAQECKLTENAAQKAVARALDALNAALTTRGITSTAAALELALAHGTMAAPATLAEAITTSASTIAVGGTVASAGAGAAALKLAVGMVLAASIAIPVGYFTGMQRQLDADLRDGAGVDSHSVGQMRMLTSRLRAETQRATQAEADTATLLREIERQRAVLQQAQPPPAPTSTPAVQEPVGSVNVEMPYVVQPRDTFAKIARAYGVTLDALIAANPNYDYRRMRVGQVITLPAGASLQDNGNEAPPPSDLSSATEYVVRRGDSIARIATEAGLSADDIRRLNPDVDWSNVTVGQKIRLR